MQVVESSFLECQRQRQSYWYALLKHATLMIAGNTGCQHGLDVEILLANANPFLLRNAIACLEEYSDERSLQSALDDFRITAIDASEAAKSNSFVSSASSLEENSLGHSGRWLRLPQNHGKQLLVASSSHYLKGVDALRFSAPVDPLAFASVLSKAIDACICSPTIHAALLRDISHFVPVEAGGEGVHCSHTSVGLPGVIFLSFDPDPVRIAEAIVHEHGHTQLNVVMQFDKVIEDDGQLFYSPWRPDPRPPDALLHAVFVFSRVAEWYMDMLGTDTSSDRAQYRLPVLLHQLRIGLSQLRQCRATETGKNLLDECEEIIEVLGRLSCCDSEPPSRVTEHFRTWRNANSEIGAADLEAFLGGNAV